MKLQISTTFFILFMLFLVACKQNTSTDIHNAPAQTAEGVNVIIEIPAGTNHKIEVNKTTKQFEVDQEDGKDRIIDFLPYPGNYGYIPSTLMDEDRGGDGDALDILVLCESLETGTKIPVIPIATLMLRDGGEIDTKLIAVPADSTLRVMDVTNYQEFVVKYSMAQNIIQDWFLNYKGLGEMEFLGWRDDRYAMAEIRKWTIDREEE